MAATPQDSDLVKHEIDKLKQQYKPRISLHAEILERYKVENLDLLEKKKELQKKLQENQIGAEISEDQQIMRKRNQIADLHEKIQA